MGTPKPSTFRRAVLLMTATSFLVPVGGLITAPILARALGPVGRGEMAAALAPAYLALAAATLGLPEALTFYLAKHPRITRPSLWWGSLMTIGLGGVCLLSVFLALPFLSAGDPRLGDLVVLAMAMTIPALVVGVFRGAAIGRQMWRAVALERLLNTALRILTFGTLWLLGELTVFVAVLVSVLIPIVTGVVYLGLLSRPADPAQEPPPEGGSFRRILRFGSKVWLGSVASMLLSRSSALLMAPLSSVEDLGLYTVASTISDLPLIVALAIQGALYGTNSKSADPDQVTTTSRIAIFVGIVGCLLLAGTLPFWIEPLFGEGFGDATVPTLILMLSAILCIPGMMASSGISAWGRPGLRSLGLAITLLAYVGTFVALVPHFGVLGACLTSIVSNLILTSYMVLTASRVMKVQARRFLLVRRSDILLAWREVEGLVRRLGSRRDRDREQVTSVS